MEATNFAELLVPRVRKAVAKITQHSEESEEDFSTRLMETVMDLGEMDMYPEYKIALRRWNKHAKRDTENQGSYFEVSWKTTTEALPETTWSRKHMVEKLEEDHKKSFQAEIDKYTEKEWWNLTKRAQTAERRIASTGFPAKPTEGKSTRVRPVTDQRPTNAVSPPVTKSQMSVKDAIDRMRGAACKIVQRDLSQAFMRMHMSVRDPQGHQVALVIQCVGRECQSERMVFGLAVGPLAPSTTMVIMREIAGDSLMKPEVRRKQW
jgi:hypothetical protein